ncbi:MAG: serine hydrolase domain-containing protein [Fibrobacter sp.]|nr:serine hydrolase domain-containing protein [Fibrobacter sp.]
MIDAMRMLLKSAVESEIFPGCVVGIRSGAEQSVIACGNYTYDSNSEPVNENSIYDVASITKAIPVSCLALKLIDEGKLRRHQRLIEIIPELAGTYKEMITIDNLLTQTLDFDFRLSKCKDMQPEQILKTVFEADLRSCPGLGYSYANATSILLGIAIERCCGKDLASIAQDTFFTPLGMDTTTFFPENLCRDNIAPSEDDPWRGRVIRGEVHDESTWALRPKVVGAAGLFSTVPDLMKFMDMLINGGEVNGKRYLSSSIVSQMYTNQLPSGNLSVGFGWELNQKSFMGNYCSKTAFGKTGFTGCSIVIDVEKQKGCILLSNHVYPRRRPDRSVINRIRCKLCDILWKAV